MLKQKRGKEENMNTLTININEVTEASCPYGDLIADVCRASISSMKLGLIGCLKYCTSEDYDGCPIFLAKILRNGKLKLPEI
jgi:hypothetical protein